MADTLDTITKLIQSPPGQLAAGGVLAGIVWKFFERVEAVHDGPTGFREPSIHSDRPENQGGEPCVTGDPRKRCIGLPVDIDIITGLMLASALDGFTNFINSPPGQLAAGGVLAGIVWKFFDRVESVLRLDTKRENARWLRVRNVETRILADERVAWPSTFISMFDSAFGSQFSWKGVRRAFLVVFISQFAIGCIDLYYEIGGTSIAIPPRVLEQLGSAGLMLVSVIAALVLIFAVAAVQAGPSLFLYLVSRRAIKWASAHRFQFLTVPATILLPFIYGILVLAGIKLLTMGLLSIGHDSAPDVANTMWDSYTRNARPIPPYTILIQNLMSIFPLFFISIWLVLYFSASMIIKLLSAFDFGFYWFNRHTDIENKPLQSIGLVAGVLVALVYWSAVLVSRVVK